MSDSALSARALAWATAGLVALGLYVVFAPGHYSFDAAHLWWMVRHDEFTSTQPALMGRLWQAARAVLPDPQGFFALQVAVVCAGLALVAEALPVPRWAVPMVVIGLVAWPAFGALLPQVWKDVWLLGALLVATGALLHAQRSGAAGWRGLAFVMLAMGIASRFNAITGVLPLLAWLIAIEWRQAKRVGARWPRGRALAVLPVLLLASWLPTAATDARPAPAWPYVALWDLAAVGLETETMRIPPSLIAPGATNADFARVFREDINTTTVGAGLTLYSDDQPLPTADRNALLFAWLSLPFEEPAAYADHRWRLARHLFGADGLVRDPGLMLMPGIVPFRDNPPLQPSSQPLAGWLQGWWQGWTSTPVFEGRWYLLLAVAALLVGLWRRRWPAVAVAASGLGLALPLLVVAPSAEFRFLLWLVAAAPLSALLLFERRRDSAADGGGGAILRADEHP